MSERDLVGYGATPPVFFLPGAPGSRSTSSSLRGWGRRPVEGSWRRRHSCTRWSALRPPSADGTCNTSRCSSTVRRASGAATGSSCKHELPMTVYAVGEALERNPEAARARSRRGWEVASHGWRWIDYMEMSEDGEREHMRRADHRRSRESPGSARSARSRGGSRTTRAASSSRRAVSSTTPIPTPTSCPTGSRSPGGSTSPSVHARRQRLQVPARERLRDRRPVHSYLVDASTSYARKAGGCFRSACTAASLAVPDRRRRSTRSSATPPARGRVGATRAEIARHWHEHHPARALLTDAATVGLRCQTPPGTAPPDVDASEGEHRLRAVPGSAA